MTVKHKKHEGNYTNAYQNQLLKLSNKEKILEATRGGKRYSMYKASN